MQLDPIVRDRDSYSNALARAIDDLATVVYLDTSLLTWLVRVNEGARKDFISWCERRPQGSVRVPVWAAHEFQRHVLKETLRTDFNKVLSDTRKQYERFAAQATESADERLCVASGFSERSEYVAELSRYMVNLKRLLDVFPPGSIAFSAQTEEVIGFVNSHPLTSDLEPIIQRLSATGDFRYGHHVPPGFEDAGKGEDKFGDAVIWEEILQDVRRNQGPLPLISLKRFRLRARKSRPASIFITREQKPDWMSSAAALMDIGIKTTTRVPEIGVDVPLPHPLLAHEHERAGGGRFFLAHPAFLVSVVQDDERAKGIKPSVVREWREACVPPHLADSLALRKKREERVSAKAAPEPRSAPPANGSSQENVLAPSGRESIPAPKDEVGVELRSLILAMPWQRLKEFEAATNDDRARLLVAWTEAVASGELSPHGFGRLVAELLLRNASPTASEIAAILETLASASLLTMNAVALGAMTRSFFDDQGELLKTPQVALGTILAICDNDDRFKAALRALADLLGEAKAELPYVPGSHAEIVLKIVATKSVPGQARMLQELRIGQSSVLLLGRTSDASRLISRLLKRDAPSASAGELQGLVSRQYLIPMSRIRVHSIDRNTIVTWPPDAALASLNTDAPEGISGTDDSEDHHGN